MLQADEEIRYGFHNGYASQRGYNGVGRAGYAIQVVRVGHLNCKCMLSGDSFFFRPHDPATGEWPVTFLVSDFYAFQFMHAHPEWMFAPGCIHSASYGSVITVQTVD